MATEMQLKVILAGNHIATGVLSCKAETTKTKDKNGKQKFFLYLCCLKY